MEPTEDAAQIDGILRSESLTPLFQPIVDARRRVIFGYEALIRGPSATALHSPVSLFQAAAQSGRLVEIDQMARRLAIRRFMRLGLEGRLFLNIMPQTLLQKDFREGATLEFLRSEGLDPQRVVIELTEQCPIHDYDLIRRALNHYREMGFQVALDDLGDGSAGLRHWAELNPDFIKTSRHFCEQIELDPTKRKFMGFLMEVSRSLGCEVIVEGVERLEEYRCLWGLNSQLLQGYYFAHPTENPPREIHHMLPGNGPWTSADSTGTAQAICRPDEPIAADAPVAEVSRRLAQLSGLRSIAVTRDNRPIGVVHRDDLLAVFSNPYAHSLYGKRSVQTFVRSDALIVSEETPLEELSRRITDYSEKGGEDFVVVDASGNYRGMASVLDLLREMTALQVKNARQANPLSGLPGNILINDTLGKCLAQRRPFVAVYCDLDHFKAYNDYYGHARGDEVIVGLADVLRQQISGPEDFVGHVGGDDFALVMLDLHRWRKMCAQVLEAFGRLAPTFYDECDRQEGGIRVEDRQGRVTYFPLVSLSMAALPIVPGALRSPHEISSILSEAKHQAKLRPGNTLFVDRRNYSFGASSGATASTLVGQEVPAAAHHPSPGEGRVCSVRS